MIGSWKYDQGSIILFFFSVSEQPIRSHIPLHKLNNWKKWYVTKSGRSIIKDTRSLNNGGSNSWRHCRNRMLFRFPFVWGCLTQSSVYILPMNMRFLCHYLNETKRLWKVCLGFLYSLWAFLLITNFEVIRRHCGPATWLVQIENDSANSRYLSLKE